MATIFSDLGAAKAECSQIADEVQQFLQANGRRPPAAGVEPIRLALFGQYNAGKSTIVNALLGERAAVTGDAPETKLAQVYSVKGFEIADLPGGDARLQESEEALGALKSAHAVLYVVSSATGLDYDTMWEDLKLLVARASRSSSWSTTRSLTKMKLRSESSDNNSASISVNSRRRSCQGRIGRTGSSGSGPRAQSVAVWSSRKAWCLEAASCPSSMHSHPFSARAMPRCGRRHISAHCRTKCAR